MLENWGVFIIMPRRLTKEEFIEKAKAVHGNKYDYSKVEYINNHTKVCIVCPIHGDFMQMPMSHLVGKGCERCRHIGVSKQFRKSQEYIISKFKQVHGSRYDYSKVEYVSHVTKVCIICPEHGEFWQKPNNHIAGQGCPYCARDIISNSKRYDTATFIAKAKNVHGDKFGYDLVSYKDSLTPVKIQCPKHGIFLQKPVKHLMGCGCQRCKDSRGALMISQWLIGHKIEYRQHYKIIPTTPVLFGRRYFLVDFFIPRYNVIIEYNGKQHYERVKFWHTDDDFQCQQDRDRRLREHCRLNHIKLIEIPYTKTSYIDKILSKNLSL